MNLLPPARVIRAVTFADFGEFVHPSDWPTLRTRPCAFLPSAVLLVTASSESRMAQTIQMVPSL